MLFWNLIAIAIFWSALLALWLIISRFAVRRWGRPARIVRTVGIAACVALALFSCLDMARSLLLDEPLARAVNDGNIREVRSLLSRGASPNALLDDCPAIVLAASQGRTQITRELIQHGADVNAKEDWEHTALYYAKYNGDKEIVRILKKAGAKE